MMTPRASARRKIPAANPDRHVPGQAASLALAAQLRSHLAEDASIAIHCRNGIGRASTLAAILLVLEGAQPQQAWKLITAARGLDVPDTDAQREFILNLDASKIASKPAAPRGAVPSRTSRLSERC